MGNLQAVRGPGPGLSLTGHSASFSFFAAICPCSWRASKLRLNYKPTFRNITTLPYTSGRATGPFRLNRFRTTTGSDCCWNSPLKANRCPRTTSINIFNSITSPAATSAPSILMDRARSLPRIDRLLRRRARTKKKTTTTERKSNARHRYLVEKSCSGRGCALWRPTRNSSSGVLGTDIGTLARRAVGLRVPPKSRPAVGSTVLIGPLSVPGSNDRKGHRPPCSKCTFWWCDSIIWLRSCRKRNKTINQTNETRSTKENRQ